MLQCVLHPSHGNRRVVSHARWLFFVIVSPVDNFTSLPLRPVHSESWACGGIRTFSAYSRVRCTPPSPSPSLQSLTGVVGCFGVKPFKLVKMPQSGQGKIQCVAPWRVRGHWVNAFGMHHPEYPPPPSSAPGHGTAHLESTALLYLCLVCLFQWSLPITCVHLCCVFNRPRLMHRARAARAGVKATARRASAKEWPAWTRPWRPRATPRFDSACPRARCGAACGGYFCEMAWLSSKFDC